LEGILGKALERMGAQRFMGDGPATVLLQSRDEQLGNNSMGTSEDSSPDEDPLPARRVTVTDVPLLAGRVQRHKSKIERL